KQWEAIHNLIQSIGFSDIDDMNILSGDNVAKTFEQSREKIIKIREDALLLFGFKTRAKGMPDLNATIKFINAILSNWCGYTIKSGRIKEGPKDQRVWKSTYWIYRVPRDGAGFETIERIKAIKLNAPNYRPTNPILPPYKPELINETQDLFDSIPITNNITSECTKHEVSDSSNNTIDKKALSLEMLAQDQSIDSNKISEHREDHTQDICHVNTTTISEASTAEKKIPESLVTLCLPPAISLSSEFLIKNESDIDTLIFYLQQKFSMPQERLEKWKTKIAFEMRDNHNYWKKERE
ncbi:19499_t:CDS:1, partial [Gigaspora margarita]